MIHNSEPDSPIRLVGSRALAKILGLKSPAQVMTLAENGHIPRPFRLSPRANWSWDLSEVEAYIARRRAEARMPAPDPKPATRGPGRPRRNATV